MAKNGGRLARMISSAVQRLLMLYPVLVELGPDVSFRSSLTPALTLTLLIPCGEVIAFDLNKFDQIIEWIAREKTGAQRQRTRLNNFGSGID
jgi:hypothetical protein